MVKFISGIYGVPLDDPTFILNTDNIYLQCQTNIATTNIILPKISDTGKTWGFKIFINDVGNNASVKNITITPNVADKINGSASAITINTNGSNACIEIVGSTAWKFSSSAPTISGLGYKTYVALMSQNGIIAPAPFILQNTLGNIVWAYIDVGRYSGTLAGAFADSKTFLLIQKSGTTIDPSLNRGAETAIIKQDQDTILINTVFNSFNGGGFFQSAFQDNILSETSIEIRVYN